MNKFSAFIPTEKIQQSLVKASQYARHPYGIAGIGSVALHLVAAIALPGWSEAEENLVEERPEIVRMVNLPAEVQDRLPGAVPPLDLSVFETNPDFNIDLSAIDPSAIAYDSEGNRIGLIEDYQLAQGQQYLPVPNAPISGSGGPVNFSYIPNISPPPISSTFTGFAPPPPSLISILPPPPSVPSGGNSTVFGTAVLNGPNFVSGDGEQQVFSVNPESGQLSLLQRQRQLEQNAAITLAPESFTPSDPNLGFRAGLLRPSDLNTPENASPRGTTSAPTSNPAIARAVANKFIAGNYPRNACRSRASGTAVYQVVVTPGGVPTQWSLSRSSGSSALDNQASRDIRNTRFDGAARNYVTRVTFSHNDDFCAAFAQPSTPSTGNTDIAPAETNPLTIPQASPVEATSPNESGTVDFQDIQFDELEPKTTNSILPNVQPAPTTPQEVETTPAPSPQAITPEPPRQSAPSINLPAEPITLPQSQPAPEPAPPKEAIAPEPAADPEQ